MDDVDIALLERLMEAGRASWAQLAEELSLTAPAVAHRVRRLEERGIIRQFSAWVEPAAVAPVCAFVAVNVGSSGRQALYDAAREWVAIQECHRVAGEDEHLLKVRCGTITELDALLEALGERVGPAAGIRTSVVLASVKESPVLPIGGVLE
jgi:Lrp/AsnC family leucine-responsive transcriptional regulator